MRDRASVGRSVAAWILYLFEIICIWAIAVWIGIAIAWASPVTVLDLVFVASAAVIERSLAWVRHRIEQGATELAVS